MKNVLFVLFTVVAVPATAMELAEQNAVDGCLSCHGPQALGSAPGRAPRLAGQNRRYLAEQLKNFRNGARGYHPDDVDGRSMRSRVVGLDDKAIVQLADMLSRMQVPVETPNLVSGADLSDADFARGRELYEDHCLACHGERGRGVSVLYAPNLRILSDWYLSSQIDKYRDGWRGAEPQATTRAKAMRAIVTQISTDDDWELLIEYLTL